MSWPQAQEKALDQPILATFLKDIFPKRAKQSWLSQHITQNWYKTILS